MLFSYSVKDMETTLEAIRKRKQQQSGLKINENKTEICLFFKLDTNAVIVKFGMDQIASTKSISVLICLSQHIRKAIVKSTRSLNALKILRKYFNTKEMLQLVTSNYFSVLYYYREVWHLHTLKQFDKNLLLTASLMLATHYKYPIQSTSNN
jgi:hypothetical protein